MDYSCGATRYEDDCFRNSKDIGVAKDNKNASKRNIPCTKGTAMLFGFRRRPASGIPVPVSSYGNESTHLHPRSKSAGPEQNRKRDEDGIRSMQNSSSGRSTPRLVAPKKESSNTNVRTNRFGYRQQQPRYTKESDICSSHSASHCNQEKLQQQENHPSKHTARVTQVYNTPTISKLRQPQVNNTLGYGGTNSMNLEAERRPSGIPEPINKYTLHTSHLPLPQYAVRMKDPNSKFAKTATNQSRKVSGVARGISNYRDDSGNEDSGVDSQMGYYVADKDGMRDLEYLGGCSMSRIGRSRISTNARSFDVRDVRDEDSTVTEISVIPLQKSIGTSLNASGIRERSVRSPRITEKDNRYMDMSMSISTTSSEGYDLRSGEEKVYKDTSHSEKVSLKSDASSFGSDGPEYGHGEAMAEYSLSSSDECRHCSGSTRESKNSCSSSKNGTLPKNSLRSVLLTIEDPAFAAVAATSTTLIDDETSPVDSLLDSPTASITQSDGKNSRKDNDADQVTNVPDNDGPETPTNTSNSLSLSEGREYFDDEIADQPGLIFDDSARPVGDKDLSVTSHAAAENSQTLVESTPKNNVSRGKNPGKSPSSGQRISRAGSVDTLSPCESIDSDDLMLDYERSDTSSHEGSHRRLESNPALHELDDATILSELEVQGEEVMRQWSSLLGTSQTQQQTNFNSVNNNFNADTTTDNNNHPTTDSGIAGGRTSRLLRRSGVDSPHSIDSMRNQVPSPLRTPQNVQSPNVDSGDESSRTDRGTYQYMFQDIVSIKTMLLKLKRVLQEAETVAPFNNSAKNGLFYNMNDAGTADVSTSPVSAGNSIADELADLRRQVVFLQGQLEDRDRTIQGLQYKMSKLQGPNAVESQSKLSAKSNNTDTSNAATQTDKTRTVSASSSSLLQSLPQDGSVAPLVSWSDSWNNQQPSAGRNLENRRRKSSDGLQPREKSRQDHQTTKQTNGRSLKQYEVTTENSTWRPFVSSPRKVSASSVSPRTVRTLSLAGRSHNA